MTVFQYKVHKISNETLLHKEWKLLTKEPTDNSRPFWSVVIQVPEGGHPEIKPPLYQWQKFLWLDRKSQASYKFTKRG